VRWSPWQVDQESGDLLHESVSEIVLLRITAHIGKGQDSNGGLVGQGSTLEPEAFVESGLIGSDLILVPGSIDVADYLVVIERVGSSIRP